MRRPLVAAGLLTASLVVSAACPTPEQAARLADDWSAMKPLTGMDSAISVADARCTQARLVAQLEKSQGPVVGYKAGLTNKAVQQRFAYDAPVRGTLFQAMLLPDHAQIPPKFASRPLMEADLIVEVADEGINGARTPAEVMRHVSRIIPFIELPDLVVDPQTPLTGTLLLAINAGARLGVMGKPLPASPDLVEPLGKMTVTLKDQTGAELGKGEGSAILGHPLNAVIWIAEDLARSGGKLKAGDLLSLGSFHAPVPPRPGRGVTATYEGLPGTPTVSVSFQ